MATACGQPLYYPQILLLSTSSSNTSRPVLLMRKSAVSHRLGAGYSEEKQLFVCFTPAVCGCVLLGSELKVTLR